MMVDFLTKTLQGKFSELFRMIIIGHRINLLFRDSPLTIKDYVENHRIYQVVSENPETTNG